MGLLFVVLAGCSSSSTNPADTCAPGDLKQCSCPGGQASVRACSGGQFGDCQCGDAGVGGVAGTGGAAGSGGLGGTGATSTGGAGGGAEPPSCKGLADCVPGHSCCESLPIPAGAFQRDAKTESAFEATVGAFRLDAFEVTVGRFRSFVMAVVNEGFKPVDGSGKHQPEPVAGEPGWLSELSVELWASLAEWEAKIAECPGGGASSTFSSTPGPKDALPMNCVSFPQAYAFCIWDGGYLPTEAELGYAWVGQGKAPRKYPWGDTAVDAEHAVYGISPQGSPPPVGSKPKGVGPFGHHDLFGSMFEYTLDHFDTASYPLSPCVDCAKLTTNQKANRAIRGGGWVNLGDEISAGSRLPWFWGGHNTGFRCARPAG